MGHSSKVLLFTVRVVNKVIDFTDMMKVVCKQVVISYNQGVRIAVIVDIVAFDLVNYFIDRVISMRGGGC